MTEPLATVTNYADLVEAFRTIKASLGLSNEFCDKVGGLTDGHTDKALGPTQAKNISPMLFDLFCSMFAVRFEMVVDLDAVKQMESRWEERQIRNVRTGEHRVSKIIIERAKPHVLRATGILGAAVRSSMLRPEHRSAIASKASKIRWKRKGLKMTRRAKAKRAWWRKRRMAAKVQGCVDA